LLLNAGVEAAESVLLPLLHEGAVTGIKTTINMWSVALGSSFPSFLREAQDVSKVKSCLPVQYYYNMGYAAESFTFQ
jgi:hypothetical protein